jgi:hypothetical protein
MGLTPAREGRIILFGEDVTAPLIVRDLFRTVMDMRAAVAIARPRLCDG